ncbi:hypothetical protein VNO80_03887 [Phaseolus coccineus]|uniref:t-SNARE coiled-coil homology domain-containing protein n=1 Tax=Phaseolus coccineus TaxID=3886 RepID=A0AAN9NU04_PHACN
MRSPLLICRAPSNFPLRNLSELIRESQFWGCDFFSMGNLFCFCLSCDHLVACGCYCFRDNRNNRVSLFDGIEEGGIRAQSVYSSSHEIDEHDNEQALDGLQDRVNLLKRLSGDINEEVDSHNRMLDRMGNDMDSSRGVLSGTMDKFKMVFETKSSRRMFSLVASFVVIFLIIYYLTK